MFPIYYDVPWLEGKDVNYYSQFGEDGLLAAIFDRIGVATKWCFEIGAADGVWFSNTAQFVKKRGWRAVLIEGAPHYWDALGEYAHKHNCIAVNTMLPNDGLDKTLEQAGAPQEIDLGVIDVDGPDYWMWAGMVRYRPRVMVVEYRCSQPCLEQIPPPENATAREQAGGETIRKLGLSKGYTLMVATSTNMIFVRDDIDITGPQAPQEINDDERREKPDVDNVNLLDAGDAGGGVQAEPEASPAGAEIPKRGNRVSRRGRQRPNSRLRRRL